MYSRIQDLEVFLCTRSRYRMLSHDNVLCSPGNSGIVAPGVTLSSGNEICAAQSIQYCRSYAQAQVVTEWIPTLRYILIDAPLAPRSARPSIATRVTMLSFCGPSAVACETEYAEESGGLPERDWRL